MLAIRLSRTGSKKQAHYRVVVCETKQATEGRMVEIVGHYNPRTVPATLTVDRDRIAHWLKAGARPSQTVRTLLAGQAAPAPDRAAAAPQAGAQ
jgi:small subunit ribosomal protein S16